MKTIKGDLIKLAKDGKFDVIVHGCNCFHTMGAGIAAQIRKKFPDAYDADLSTLYGDKSKLGTYSYSIIKIPKNNHNFYVINAYTQYDFRGKKNVDYDAIKSVFKLIKQHFPNFKIGYPMIGAGLAGGNWGIISKIIDEELQGEDHTLVIFQK